MYLSVRGNVKFHIIADCIIELPARPSTSVLSGALSCFSFLFVPPVKSTQLSKFKFYSLRMSSLTLLHDVSHAEQPFPQTHSLLPDLFLF